VEEELIKESFPREEIMKLCEVHLAVFRESVEKERQRAQGTSPFHPINILMKEHEIMTNNAQKLVKIFKGQTLESYLQDPKAQEEAGHLIQHFKDAEKHYLREENALFPFLEKHGVTEPPKIMWMEHDEIRKIKKALFEKFDGFEKGPTKEIFNEIAQLSEKLLNTIMSHFFKENTVLFPTALKVMGGR